MGGGVYNTRYRQTDWLLSLTPHTLTPHTLTPHTLTPHTLTPHTLTPHTLTPHTAMPIDRGALLRRVSDLLRTQGVPAWAARWRRHAPFALLERHADQQRDDAVFLRALSDHIRAHYHKHSHLSFHARAPAARPRPVAARDLRDPAVRYYARERIGYVCFPTAGGRIDRHARLLRRQAALVHDALSAWRRAGRTRGLIVDLRRHRGGDVYTFATGLRSLFEGVARYAWGARRVARAEARWEVGLSGAPSAFTTDALSCGFPVAVLVGPRTASAGEADAAMLFGKPRVRVFGAGPTAGLLSGNRVLPLGGAFGAVELVLTGALVTTTDGTFHTEERIVPDVLTARPLAAAKKWIGEEARDALRRQGGS
jgi:Peptidase family S41